MNGGEFSGPVDPSLALAFSIQAGPSVYAVLVGSGLSKSAGVPTGWQVVEALVRRVAALKGEASLADWEAWYMEQAGVRPDYPSLLMQVAATPAERQRLLRGFFEPTEEERLLGLKEPTLAHKAIADLVVRGSVRIIVTTNFDRLMERALEIRGVFPTIIATESDAAIPGALAHGGCVVVKPNGDYLSDWILNTPAELAKYSSAMGQLLARVADEYGLVIAGWSGEWDTALAEILRRVTPHRFATYWAKFGELTFGAESIISARGARVIPTTGADAFFRDLANNVRALADLGHGLPVTAAVAVARVKRLMADPMRRIELHDFLRDEVDRVAREWSGSGQPRPNDPWEQARLADGLAERLAALYAAVVYYGDEEWHVEALRAATERLANPTMVTSVFYPESWVFYPLIVAIYAAGLAALASDRLQTLAELLLRVEVRSRLTVAVPLARRFGIEWEDIHGAWFRFPDSVGRLKTKTPLSDYLATRMREVLREYIPEDDVYSSRFDRLEYLLSLIFADTDPADPTGVPADPKAAPSILRGRFILQVDHNPERLIDSVTAREIERAGINWPPIAAGFLGGLVTRAKNVKARVDQLVWERRALQSVG